GWLGEGSPLGARPRRRGPRGHRAVALLGLDGSRRSPGARHPRHPGGVLAAMTTAVATEATRPAQAEGQSVLRRLLFWTHLTAGSIAGLFIGLLCLTGALLVLERPLLALVTPETASPASTWLPVDSLLARARAAGTGAAPTAVTLDRERGSAWVAL